MIKKRKEIDLDKGYEPPSPLPPPPPPREEDKQRIRHKDIKEMKRRKTVVSYLI